MAINDGVVTLKARNVAVRDLVTVIARRTGLALSLSPTLTERITIDIDGLSVPETLARILKQENFALYYVESGSGKGNTGRHRGNRLWVLPARPAGDSSLNKRAEHPSSHSALDFASPRAERTRTGTRGGVEVVKHSQRLDANATKLVFALNAGDPTTRVAAVHALADIGGDQAVAALARALSDDSSRVRAEAAHALGEIGTESTVTVLELPLNDADAHVRQAAIDALIGIGGNDAAGALAGTLHDVDPTVRKQAVYALGEIGGVTATALARQALQHPDPEIRRAAAEVTADLVGQAR